jgi:hypothetical protein
MIARRCAWLAFALALVGCAVGPPRPTLVERRSAVIGDALTVDPQIEWTSLRVEGRETWTADGFALDALHFFPAVADGHGLLPAPAKGPDTRPRFRRSMSEPEILELVVDTLFPGRPQARNLRPFEFGRQPGFRFDVDYVTPGGLQRQALVAGAVVRERLRLIVYDAVSLHYFAKHRDVVERILSSVQLH